jgi:hypothetical protein
MKSRTKDRIGWPCLAALAALLGSTTVARATDTDGDGLTDAQEAALGTNPRAADTDGDGYTDYQETNDRRLTNIPADHHTPGAARRCDPLRKDIVVELDWMGPKQAWFLKVHGHRPSAAAMRSLIERFQRRGFRVFIVVDQELPHEDEVDYTRFHALTARHRSVDVYYYGLYCDRMAEGNSGVAFYGRNSFLIADGIWYLSLPLLSDPLEGGLVMHELGHLLIDRTPANPLASHLLDRPQVWDDGAHCPYDCVMNYASKLSVGANLSQYLRFDYDHRCWGAVRGFYAGSERAAPAGPATAACR